MDKDEEAIVIRDLWGKVLSSLVIAGIVGGITFAFSQQSVNAQIAVTVEGLQESQRMQTEEQKAKFDKIDNKMESIQDDVKAVQEKQIRMESKIDMLLRNEGIASDRVNNR